jgi:ADP-heptose:LPS heptosyltransferase
MGDVCLAVPFAAALARHAEVHWLVHEVYEPIPRFFGVDAQLIPVTPCERRRKVARLDEPCLFGSDLVQRLRCERFDAVLDLAHWPLTAQLVHHLPEVPIRAITLDPEQDERLGVNPRGLDLYAPFTMRVPVRPGTHQVAKWLALARTVLGRHVSLDWLLPPQRISTSGPLRIFLHPHASKPEKGWPADRFAEVMRGLAREHQITCTINSGSRRELPTALGLWLRLRAVGIRARVVWLDRSCRTLRAALTEADLALGCDSGPMHLAALVGTPSVVVFGPHDPEEFMPLWRSLPVAPPRRGMAARAVPAVDVLRACRLILDGITEFRDARFFAA